MCATGAGADVCVLPGFFFSSSRSHFFFFFLFSPTGVNCPSFLFLGVSEGSEVCRRFDGEGSSRCVACVRQFGGCCGAEPPFSSLPWKILATRGLGDTASRKESIVFTRAEFSLVGRICVTKRTNWLLALALACSKLLLICLHSVVSGALSPLRRNLKLYFEIFSHSGLW